MGKGRYKKRKLSISTENDNFRNAAQRVKIESQTILPKLGPCNYQRTKNLMESLAKDYTLLGQHFQGIIASLELELKQIKQDVDAIKKATRLLEKKQAAQKRKRWCILCLQEASFMNITVNSSFCSEKCEEIYLNSLEVFTQLTQ